MTVRKSQQKAVHKYVKENYDRLDLTLKPKGKKEIIKQHAESRGETVNGFINRAIDEAIERDSAPVTLADLERAVAAQDDNKE